ncbi:hypothetical protein K466DRAFT_25818 [Polyporus arcularius HHB13444]|uniref:Uncharacterized protein n=1 Tax=Polyporus arcularius HHB13444 TaxID=1314778 RepID=A0A5C3PK81_9APHY|nr:hypothetical protein K466DRAFT_25818 [Polyporus arcularius HHB13444]
MTTNMHGDLRHRLAASVLGPTLFYYCSFAAYGHRGPYVPPHETHEAETYSARTVHRSISQRPSVSPATYTNLDGRLDLKLQAAVQALIARSLVSGNLSTVKPSRDNHARSRSAESKSTTGPWCSSSGGTVDSQVDPEHGKVSVSTPEASGVELRLLSVQCQQPIAVLRLLTLQQSCMRPRSVRRWAGLLHQHPISFAVVWITTSAAVLPDSC